MRGALFVPLVVGLALVSGCKKPNHAPDTPAVPSGPSSGAVGVSYHFSSSATDPDGDSVAIRFDWGDGDTSDWGRWVRPGDTVTMNHTWAASGTFTVKAQAKAQNITISDWSPGSGFAVLRAFVKTFGGTGVDLGFSVHETRGGGYIVVGRTGSFGAGNWDVWLVKTDADGDTEWTRTFGETGYEAGFSVQQTRDGAYVIVGFTDSRGAGRSDVWLIKTDAAGNRVWDRTFGGTQDDIGYSVQQTQDGGYIVGGTTWSDSGGGDDALLIKTDADGNEVWQRAIGGPHFDLGCWAEQTQDGGYIVTGYTESFGAGGWDAWLVKTDANGDTTWTKTFGGRGDDYGGCVRQTSGGGYIISGSTGSYGAGSDAWLIKTDADGNLTWSRTFGGTRDDDGGQVQQTADGGYIIAAATFSHGAGNADAWLIRTDAIGDTIWTRTFGGSGMDGAGSVQPTQDDGYIVVGYTDEYGAGGSDVWLIKTDEEGRVYGGGGK